MMLAVPPPIPGKIPMPTPIKVDRMKLKGFLNTAAKGKLTFVDLSLVSLESIGLSFRSSITFSISETANIPMSTGSNWKPALKFSIPKVQRGYESIGAAPTNENVKPRSAAITPLTREPSDKLDINVKANIVIAKYSNGPNSRATLANGGESNISIIILIKPPANDEMMERPSALPAWPFCAIG